MHLVSRSARDTSGLTTTLATHRLPTHPLPLSARHRLSRSAGVAGLLLATWLVPLAPAQAQQEQAAPAAPSAQQNRMKSCNTEASGKELKGDSRKEFMSACLSGKTPAPATAAPDGRTAQQNRMKTCNAEAGEKALKGDERKSFMSACLSGKAAASPAAPAAAAPAAAGNSTPQNRMKVCNDQAGQKELKGDERKAFMSTCLSGKG